MIITSILIARGNSQGKDQLQTKLPAQGFEGSHAAAGSMLNYLFPFVRVAWIWPWGLLLILFLDGERERGTYVSLWDAGRQGGWNRKKALLS